MIEPELEDGWASTAWRMDESALEDGYINIGRWISQH